MIRAHYDIADKYHEAVANAVAKDRKARARAGVTAGRVAQGAVANLGTLVTTNQFAMEMRDKTRSEVRLADAGKEFKRKRFYPTGTDIPVFLVVANNPFSKVFEVGYGRGRSFPALHFMARAMRAARQAGMVMRTAVPK